VNILVVEDNQSQQKVYKYWFANDSLDCCDSIQDAWELFQTKHYDAVLLDLYFGDKESGFYFLERLSKLQDVKTKVIVVSAYLDFLQELTIRKGKNLVWLTKEEATQKRLAEEIKKHENMKTGKREKHEN